MVFRFDNASISIRNHAPLSQNDMGNMDTLPKIENSTETKLDRFSEKGPGWVEITLPILTVSEANGGAKKSYKRNGKTCYKNEHWTDKHSRHRRQKGSVALMLNPMREHLSLPCHITLTRYAPKKLDRFDNLPMSMKYILDACCEVITGDYRPGRADDTEEITVSYQQVICKEYGVKIRIQKSSYIIDSVR